MINNLAAILPVARAPLEVRQVETYKPGPKEILLKNEVIALSPGDAQVAKHAIFPLEYPSIIGFSFGGTVEAVGSQITRFKAGDKVAAAYDFGGAKDNRFGGYQRYLIVGEGTASKVPDGVDVTAATSLTANISTIVGLFTGRVGLDKPSFDGPVPVKKKKVLVYGGSSSVGSLAVQYVTQAGYTVITTTSPRHKGLVSKLGAAKVVDHTQERDDLVKSLVAEGPYDVVVDSISLPNTHSITGAVVAAQGGGKLYVLQPATKPETIPEGVDLEFASWPLVLAEERNAGLQDWAFSTYLAEGLASGKLVPLPTEKASGGLNGINDALDRLIKGVSGVKLILDPWE